MNTTLVAMHVPHAGTAHWTNIPVSHINLNSGLTLPTWVHIFEGRAKMLTVKVGRLQTYKLLVPYHQDSYQESGAIWDELGLRWKGDILVFRQAQHSDLLVNMRMRPSDKYYAWEAVRKYVLPVHVQHMSRTNLPDCQG